MTDEHESAHLPRRRDIHRPTRRASRTTPRRTWVGARLGIPAALGVMALSTGLASGVSASTGIPAAVVSAVATPASDRPASATGTSPSVPAAEAGTRAPDPATLAAAQAALQHAAVVAGESVALPGEHVAKVEEEAAALRAILESRDTSGAASRAGERTSLDVRAQAGGSGGTEVTADVSAQLASATESLRATVDAAAEAAVAIEAAPDTPADILAAQKRAAKEAAPGLAEHSRDLAGFSNGRIPAAGLCGVPFAPGHLLRCDAAQQLERLDTAFRAQFGRHLELTDSYRSYPDQVATRASKGYLAATPGFSNHGWGLALDLGGGVQSFGTAEYEWLRAHAPAFGWDNPSWARPGGKKPEPWHWEYAPLS